MSSTAQRRFALRALNAFASAKAPSLEVVANACASSPVVGRPWAPTVRASFGVSSSRSRSFASDTHDDFKPKSNVSSGADISTVIAQDIEANGVIIYMKGSPQAPQCGFSNMACRILDHHGVLYTSRNVLASEELRNGIKTFSNWPTIPQIFVKGEFLGGSDILMQMHQSGELATMFKSMPKATP